MFPCLGYYSAAMNIGVYVSFQFLSFPDIYPEVGLLGHLVIFSFL